MIDTVLNYSIKWTDAFSLKGKHRHFAKDLDDDEPIVDESTRKSRSTRKDVEEDLPREK